MILFTLAPTVLRRSTPVRRSTAVLFSPRPLPLSAIQVDPSVLDAYQGYSAMNIQMWHDGLAAVLVLSPNRCNIFGDDIPLSAIYEAGMLDRLISIFKTTT